MIKSDCPYVCTDTAKCDDFCIRYRKIKYLLGSSNVKKPMDYINSQLEKTEETDPNVWKLLNEWRDNVLGFVENGNNLYISSPYIQTGKTLLSVKIMFKYFDEIWDKTDLITRGYYVPVQEMLGKLKSFKFIDTEEFQHFDTVIKETDIVIWDGITDWPLSIEEQKLLTRYIKERISSRKTNIYNGIFQNCLAETVGGILAEYIESADCACLYGKGRDLLC